jgi:hypothetical protein
VKAGAGVGCAEAGAVIDGCCGGVAAVSVAGAGNALLADVDGAVVARGGAAVFDAVRLSTLRLTVERAGEAVWTDWVSSCAADPLFSGGFAVTSAGFVAAPGKLKFRSSRGPTVSEAGVLVVAGCAVSCARAIAGSSANPAANNTILKRKFALIAPAFVA